MSVPSARQAACNLRYEMYTLGFLDKKTSWLKSSRTLGDQMNRGGLSQGHLAKSISSSTLWTSPRIQALQPLCELAISFLKTSTRSSLQHFETVASIWWGQMRHLITVHDEEVKMLFDSLKSRRVLEVLKGSNLWKRTFKQHLLDTFVERPRKDRVRFCPEVRLWSLRNFQLSCFQLFNLRHFSATPSIR